MKKKATATLLAIFLGFIGIHRFYLKQPVLGIIYLIFSWTFIPLIIALIDFIVLLSISQKKFDLKYNSESSVNQKGLTKQKQYCAICNTELTFMTTPNFGGGKLRDGQRVCRDCFGKIIKSDAKFGFISKKEYDTQKVKDLLSRPAIIKEKSPILIQTPTPTPQSTTSSNKENISVNALLKSIKSPKDIKKLEQESEKYDEKFQNSDYENTKYEKLSKIYIDAFYKACEMIFYYQFVPNLDLNTPSETLNFAFKTIDIDNYEAKRKEIGGTNYEWIAITGDDLNENTLDNVIEKPPFHFDSLIKFRQIIESDIPFEEKEASITNLAKSDKSFFDEFFDRDLNESAGKQWTKLLLKSYGVPLIDRLCDMGFDTPSKIVELDLDEIKKANGFGPQKLEQLNIAISKIKKDLIRVK